MQKAEEVIIANKLDTLIQLVAVALTENRKGQKEQIRVLALAGIAPLRIAEIIGTSGNSVNGAIAKMREAKILPNRK